MEDGIFCDTNDYVIRVLDSPLAMDAESWNALLQSQPQATPFMRHEYLSALHLSGCASTGTGWTPRFFLLERQGQLVAACVLYLKAHSRGEYVFDGPWASAYAQHGLAYYPKAVCAAPFTPVTGSRLLARTAADRKLLASSLIAWCRHQGLSGLHLLFVSDEDLTACTATGMLTRHDVQFHWTNRSPAYTDFDDFLATLSQDKRKKIRQERRKTVQSGVTFRTLQGSDIGRADWDFLYRCYARTYLEHGQRPYLNRAFFEHVAHQMPNNWLLFVADRDGQPIASSLLALQASATDGTRVAYGRYWGALERVDCLHFETCYYQPLQWCIANGYQRFEGGAQGEHKLARAMLPVTTRSAHWLAHPDFFSAVDRFLNEEREGVRHYVDELQQHSPFKPV